MHLFSQFSTLGFSDMLFLLPMALVGFVLTSEAPYHTRTAHYSFEVLGAALGVLMAIIVLGTLRVLF